MNELINKPISTNKLITINNSTKLINKKISEFINNELIQNINLPFYIKNKHESKENITEIFKYNLILSKIRTFTQHLLLNINNETEIKKMINKNENYFVIRQEIYEFTNHFFKKTNYYKNLLLIKTKYSAVKDNFQISQLHGFLMKLLQYIQFLIKDNIIVKLKRTELNNFICKIIFFNSFITLYF